MYRTSEAGRSISARAGLVTLTGAAFAGAAAFANYGPFRGETVIDPDIGERPADAQPAGKDLSDNWISVQGNDDLIRVRNSKIAADQFIDHIGVGMARVEQGDTIG